MTFQSLQTLAALISTIAMLPLYVLIWKAGGTARGFQESLRANTEAIVEAVGTLKNHEGRIGALELERAREEGRRQERASRDPKPPKAD